MIRLLPALILLAGCGYEPPMRPAKDDRIREILNGMGGSISLIGPEEPGNTMVLLFDARFPGPPAGIDEPVDFATVDRDEYVWAGEGATTVSADTGMPATVPVDLGWHASWSASELADGAYQVEAIVDMDGDFGPGASTLAGATCGDWQGFYERVPGSGDKGEVAVEGGQFLDGVGFSVTTELVDERPAFAFADEKGYQRMSLAALGALATGETYTLESTGVHADFEAGDGTPLPLDLGDPCTKEPDPGIACAAETAACEGAFSVWYPDRDGDGIMDGHPDFAEFGIRDVWPRVYVQYLGTAELKDGEPVRDDETGYPTYEPYEPEEEGVFWATENFTYGYEAALGIPMAPLGVPTKHPALSVMFPPQIAKFYPAGHPTCVAQNAPEGERCFELFDLAVPEQAAQVPRGIWSVTVVGWNGQTWAMPNELSEWGVPGRGGFDPKSQGGFILTVD